MSSLSGEKRRVVGSTSVGDPPKKRLQDIETLVYKKEEREHGIETPSIQAHGHEWKLLVYVRGNKDSSELTEYVSLFLRYVGPDEVVSVKYSVRCKELVRGDGKIHAYGGQIHNHQSRGWVYFLERRVVLENYLDEDGRSLLKSISRLPRRDPMCCPPKPILLTPF